MIGGSSPPRQRARCRSSARRGAGGGLASSRDATDLGRRSSAAARGGGSAIRASDPSSSRPLAAARGPAPVSTAEGEAAPDRREDSAPVDDAARLGNPSFVWRFGQERRLAILSRFVSLRGALVLDLGCGVGEYVRAFAREGAGAIGLDIEPRRLSEARRRLAHAGGDAAGVSLMAAAGETLPLRDGCLDAAVLNEVIEHVADDAATLREVRRVLKPDGGTCVVFAPNRLYPFETHGIFLGRRYIFGNIPFVNWLPGRLRARLVPHARAYRRGDWTRLARSAGLEIVHHGYVYPGFDNVASRWPRLAAILRAVCYRAERTPAARLGLSHLVVLRRDDGRHARAEAGGS